MLYINVRLYIFATYSKENKHILKDFMDFYDHVKALDIS